MHKKTQGNTQTHKIYTYTNKQIFTHVHTQIYWYTSMYITKHIHKANSTGSIIDTYILIHVLEKIYI